MSRFQNKPMADFPLVIENMFFTQERSISDDSKAFCPIIHSIRNLPQSRSTFISGPIKFTINIIENSGKFEIRESGNVIACGQVQIPVNVKKEQIPASLFEVVDFQCSNEDIPKTDVYRNLSIKQYQYNDTFKQIQSSNIISKFSNLSNFSKCQLICTLIHYSTFRQYIQSYKLQLVFHF